jgi:hypothetical protein
MWCGSCYTSPQEINFYVKKLQPAYEEDNVVDEDRLVPSWGNREQVETDFRQARDGDHLMVPFECDVCNFKKLKPDSSYNNNTENSLLKACIRQIMLDSFWSRATSTVRANKEKTRLALELSNSVGLESPYIFTEFLPPYDHCGYEVAIQMLLASKRPGRHSQEYTQYDTIRKIRTAFSNFSRASVQANLSVTALGDDKGYAQRLVQDQVSSYWFSKFFQGCKRRMGQDWRPNLALTVELITRLFRQTKDRYINTLGSNQQDKMDWLVFGFYIVVTYTLSLRGPEGLLVDFGGLRKHNTHNSADQHVIIALKGKVKGEQNEKYHLLPCCNLTSSGINVRDWMWELIALKQIHHQVSGPAISRIDGTIMTTSFLDVKLAIILEEIFDCQPELFPTTLRTNKDELGNAYQVYRTLRRSPDTRAIEQNVSKVDIETINRWHGTERAAGNRPNRAMYQHYAQVDLLIKPYIRYTKAM